MELTIIALITATLLGFIFWLSWRRDKVHGNLKCSHRLSGASNTIDDKISTPSEQGAMPSPGNEVQTQPEESASSARQVMIDASESNHEVRADAENNTTLRKIEQLPKLQPKNLYADASKSEFGNEVKEQAQPQQAGMPQPNLPAQSRDEPDGTDRKSAEAQISTGIDVITVIETVRTSSDAPQFNPSSTETFPTEYEKSAADIGALDKRTPEQTTSKVEANSTTCNEPKSECMVPETEVAPSSASSPSEEDDLDQIEAGTEQAPPVQETEQPIGENAENVPQRYRPPPQRPPRPATTRPANRELEPAVPSEVSLEIRVRLTFDRFDFCEIGLLSERKPEMDDEVTVKFRGVSLRLMAQEDWYQDLQFENIGDILRQGLELKGRLADNRRVRWLLTGRDFYVLASHQRASGFISTNRLALGRSHVVLCVNELLQQVEAVLIEAGCDGYTKFDESHGVPRGWVALRGVLPTKAIPLSLGSDPFYAVKPAPDIEIQLEGGVCLRNSVWLAGYPPRIKLLGQSNGAVKVLIDGKEAEHSPEGFFLVDGYDRSGQQHSVYCEGLSCSCSYSIEEPPDSWAEWPAYHFGEADICGPLVHPVAQAANRILFIVPMSNPLLIGAEPGQVFRCSTRSVSHWKGFVPFDVAWALPAHPLRCDKKTARILQFAKAPIAPARSGTKAVLDWCKAVRDASRKGLRVENDSPEAIARWAEYKKAARKMWRAAR